MYIRNRTRKIFIVHIYTCLLCFLLTSHSRRPIPDFFYKKPKLAQLLREFYNPRYFACLSLKNSITKQSFAHEIIEKRLAGDIFA